MCHFKLWSSLGICPIYCLFVGSQSNTCEVTYLVVVLICISLTTGDAEHLFLSLLAICVSSSENIFLGPLPIFLIGLFVFLILSCMSFLYIMDITPYQIYDLQIFSSIQ